MIEILVGFFVVLIIAVLLGAALFILERFSFAFFVVGMILLALTLLWALGWTFIRPDEGYLPDWVMIMGGVGFLFAGGAALVTDDDF